jgi:hypothetical protein
MDAIRVYDKLIQTLDGTITLHAREHQNRDYQPAPERAGHRAGPGHDHPLRDGHGRALSDGQGLRQLLPLVKGSVASAGRLKGLTGGKMGNAYLRWAFGEVAVICKRAHRMITPYAERLVVQARHLQGQRHPGQPARPRGVLHAAVRPGLLTRNGSVPHRIIDMARTEMNPESRTGKHYDQPLSENLL